MEVNVRDFRANLSKLLNEKEVVIIRDGEPIGVYTKGAPTDKGVYTCPPTSKKFTKYLDKNKGLSFVVGNYACGCKRGETKLCPKHHRT